MKHRRDRDALVTYLKSILGRDGLPERTLENKHALHALGRCNHGAKQHTTAWLMAHGWTEGGARVWLQRGRFTCDCEVMGAISHGMQSMAVAWPSEA